MALKLPVKLGQVNNLSDARYAAGMGVEAIGFCINSGESAGLTSTVMNDITKWLAGVRIVGEVGGTLNADLEAYNFDILEVNNPALLSSETKSLLRIATTADNIDSLNGVFKDLMDQVEYYIVEVNSEELPDLGQQLKALSQKYSIYIATSFDPYNLHYVTEVVQPLGIELKGGVEEKPGLSSYDGIADILELLEAD